jgi:hypothetical protein
VSVPFDCGFASLDSCHFAEGASGHFGLEVDPEGRCVPYVIFANQQEAGVVLSVDYDLLTADSDVLFSGTLRASLTSGQRQFRSDELTLSRRQWDTVSSIGLEWHAFSHSGRGAVRTIFQTAVWSPRLVESKARRSPT